MSPRPSPPRSEPLKIERLRPAVLRVTLHAFELSTVMAAARWAAEGGEGELTEQARDQLRQVLASYDAEIRGQDEPGDGRSGEAAT